MFNNVKNDFKRFASKTSYKGRLRIFFIVLTYQGFQAMVCYRLSRWLVKHRVPLLNILVQRWAEMTTGISIPPAAIGKSLMIEHFGGIVINASAVVGDNCTIAHGVTLGNKIPGGGAPNIGNNVYICTGAKVLGEITIGDNCIIGANAVVLKSAEANSVLVGIPAKVIKKVDPQQHGSFIDED
ncbi:MAG: serine O-acetyltransferase [Lysobacterales bacterium]|jgi:serine O-acetyltransferase